MGKKKNGTGKNSNRFTVATGEEFDIDDASVSSDPKLNGARIFLETAAVCAFFATLGAAVYTSQLTGSTAIVVFALAAMFARILKYVFGFYFCTQRQREK